MPPLLAGFANKAFQRREHRAEHADDSHLGQTAAGRANASWIAHWARLLPGTFDAILEERAFDSHHLGATDGRGRLGRWLLCFIMLPIIIIIIILIRIMGSIMPSSSLVLIITIPKLFFVTKGSALRLPHRIVRPLLPTKGWSFPASTGSLGLFLDAEVTLCSLVFQGCDFGSLLCKQRGAR